MSVQTYDSAKTFSLPPGGGPLIVPYAIEAAWASLPVFCASEPQASVLDSLIEFMTDGGYQMINRACPSTQQQGNSNVILANQTFEDQISVPAGSFLTMIGGITTATDAQGLFRFSLYDAGAQASLLDGYVNAGCVTGKFTQLPQTTTGMLTTVSGNKNLFILPSPLSISSPGQLNISITNLAALTVTIEMAFFFATPTFDMDSVEQAIARNSVLK